MTDHTTAAQATKQDAVSDADLLRICQKFNPGQDFDLAKAIRAEVLSKLRAPVALPAGYALVPIEPTPEMIEAGATERITPHASAGHGAVAGYKAMLAAAPVASAPVAGESQPVAYAVHNIDTKGDVRVAAVKPWAGPESMQDSDRWGDRWAGNRPLVYGDAAPQASEAVRDALQDLVEVLQKRHFGRMPDEVQRAFDAARTALSAQPGAQKGGSDVE